MAIIKNYKSTIWCNPKERQSRNGNGYQRLEGYVSLGNGEYNGKPTIGLQTVLKDANEAGHTMAQFLPRIVDVKQKDGSSIQKVVIDMRTFKGK